MGRIWSNPFAGLRRCRIIHLFAITAGALRSLSIPKIKPLRQRTDSAAYRTRPENSFTHPWIIGWPGSTINRAIIMDKTRANSQESIRGSGSSSAGMTRRATGSMVSCKIRIRDYQDSDSVFLLNTHRKTRTRRTHRSCKGSNPSGFSPLSSKP